MFLFNLHCKHGIQAFSIILTLHTVYQMCFVTSYGMLWEFQNKNFLSQDLFQQKDEATHFSVIK